MRHTALMFSGPLKAKTEEEKVSYLLLWVGDKGRDIRHTWTDISTDDAKKLDTFYEHFKKHVRPTLNPIFARYQFNNEIQGSEAIDSFVTRLRLKSRDCDYQDSDEMIRDRIVFGTNSPKIREKLINVGRDLTLQKAIQIGQNYEYAQEQIKQMTPNDVHMVKPKTKRRVKRSNRSGTTMGQRQSYWAMGFTPQGYEPQTGTNKTRCEQDAKCTNCGYDAHKSNEVCPAKGQICRKCNKLNHFQRVCRSKSVHEVNSDQFQSEESDLDSDFYVDTVNKSFSHYDQAFATVNIGPKKTPIKFKIDTGSQVNIILLSTFHELNIKHPLLPPETQLSSYTGNPLNVRGTINLNCRYKAKQIETLFYLVETSRTPLMSLKTSLDLSLIQLIYSIDNPGGQNEICTKEQIMCEYPDLFKGVGLIPGDVELHLKPDAIPVINAPRRIPVALRERFRTELTRMENAGIVAKVTCSTDWVNSFVIVEKPKTKSLRICLDPKALNDAIRRPHYPMRTFDEVLSELSEAAYFSVLDATSGYWSLKLEDKSSYLTTFNTPFGRYRYLRIPFGLNCSQDVFQRKIDETFEGMAGVTAIVDDILVFGKTRAEHDQNLRKVLTRAHERGFKLNADKLKIGVTEVRYFGNILTQNGLKIDDKKLSAIRQMDAPNDRSELETILGMVTYLTRFAPNLATLTAPLRNLLKKDIEFVWNESHDEAFQKIKDVLTDSPVLAYFNPKLDVTLQVGASKYRLGATLLQEGRPVSYASKTLTQTEIGYAQIEKEMLGILFGAKRFHEYIYGRRVTVESDAKPLSSIAKKPLSSAPLRLQRILLQLQRYDLDIKHVSGRDIPLADTLSRKFLPDTYPELSEGLDLHVHTVFSTISVSDRKLEQVRQATRNDVQFQTLKRTILDGWPETRKMCPPSILEY